MRLLKLLVLIVLCSTWAFGQTSAGQTPAQHGIQLGDIDRAADPCNDFFQYANGAWRAQNPIPASMSRWSRRWQAGELSKDQLKDILDNVSRKHDWPSGSVEQLIGDYYPACTNHTRVNQS